MTALATRAEPSGREAGRWHPRRVLLVAAAMIVVHLAFRAWAIYGSWYQIDDYNLVSLMYHGDATPVTATATYFGHIMPGGNYLGYLNHRLVHYNWPLPATELLLMQAVGVLGFLRLLLTLAGGPRPGILPPLAIFLFTSFPAESMTWWSAAINLLPFQIALTFALTAHVTYLRTGRLQHAVVADLWIAFGLLFFEKSALIYVLVALVTLCYFAHGRGLTRLASAIRGRWAALAIYVGTGLLYIASYLVIGGNFDQGQEHPGHPGFQLAKNMVLHVYVPGTVGGPFRWLRPFDEPWSIVNPGDGLMVASAVALGLIVAEILRHRRRAARALWLPVVFLTVNVVLVLLTRANTAGAVIGLATRYEGEMALITGLTLFLATVPVAGATETVEPRGTSELLDRPRRVTALVLVVALLGTYSSIRYVVTWNSDHRGRTWIQNATGALTSSKQDIALVDTVVPYFVTNSYRYPEDLQSRILVGYPHADWTEVATDDLSMFDDRGQLREAVVEGVRANEPGPDPGCGYTVRQSPVAIPLDGPLLGGGWWVRIGYLSSGPSPVKITAGGMSHATTVQPGLHAMYVLAGLDFDSVTISALGSGVTLCTDDVTVGRIAPLVPKGESGEADKIKRDPIDLENQ
ncbi:hypothetical protein [Nocardioides halotolerans]|uniref:hypothetical protein n=1 Tax=Nocardioides halotolerans TaxID=433660 RepID=UPI00042331D9|nr:hypothetical protein [Nocardioides halotolerans]